MAKKSKPHKKKKGKKKEAAEGRARPTRTLWLVTKEAFDAAVEGMDEREWRTPKGGFQSAKVANAIGEERQAVHEFFKRGPGGRCEFLPELLESVGKPRWLAYPREVNATTAAIVDVVKQQTTNLPEPQKNRIVAMAEMVMEFARPGEDSREQDEEHETTRDRGPHMRETK